MAYDNRFVSIKSIIESVYRDSNVESLDFETAIEDIGELIGLIGVPAVYVDKNTNGIDAPVISVSDYRAKMPLDLAYLVGMQKVSLNPKGEMLRSEEMIEDPSVFFYDRVDNNQSLNYLYPTTEYPFNEIGDDGSLTSSDGIVTGVVMPIRDDAHYGYRINNNILFTSFKSGYINMAYKAYAVDDEGFVMVPDDEKFKAAVKYHLIYKIDYRKWRLNPASPGMKALLNDSEQKRDYYVASARNKANIPTVGKMESIKNRWLSLIPRINEHRNGFNTLNRQEKRRY
jgi:hypothetical protein